MDYLKKIWLSPLSCIYLYQIKINKFMYTIIVIALLASVVVYAIAKKTAKPEPTATPEITEQEIHADLHSHVEPVAIKEVAVEAPIIVADETPSVIAAAKPKKKKKPAAKKMSAKKKDA